MPHLSPDVSDGRLLWPELTRGTLISRYKRFLADVRLPNGEVVTAHCANTGRMTGCAQTGRPVYLSYHPSPSRKLKYTWELIEMPTSLVGVNTQVPNRLVAESIGSGRVAELRGYSAIQREVTVGKNSRIDLLLHNGNDERCLVEIKNCTLVTDGVARFPDAVTARGRKHLATLQAAVAGGQRGVIFYLIQRMDADVFRPADQIDPAYGDALREAAEAGVEVLAYDVTIDLSSIQLARRVACKL